MAAPYSTAKAYFFQKPSLEDPKCSEALVQLSVDDNNISPNVFSKESKNLIVACEVA